MDSILRGMLTYLFVWLIFRIAGKRSLAQITTFDAVLLLIISETTQSALTDSNNSITNSILLILTLVGIDVLLSFIKRRFASVERVLDGRPLILLGPGGLDRDVMTKERIDEDDILHAGRKQQGVGSLDDMEYAVLEQTGEISVIPKSGKS